MKDDKPNFHEQNDHFVAEITPDVMKCLAKWKFFEALDDRLCPPME